MPFSGFPDAIEVTLGTAWTGQGGLDPTDVIVLYKVSGQTYYTEDGSNTAGPSNRLKLLPQGLVSFNRAQATWYVANSSAWGVLGFASVSGATYTFLDVWSGTLTGSWWNTGYGAGFLSQLTPAYNPEVFSLIREAVLGPDPMYGTSPPADAVGIDWRSPQAVGLQAMYAPVLSRNINLRNHAPMGGLGLAPANGPAVVTDQQMGLAAAFDDASSQYCEVTFAARAFAPPMTFLCWAMSDDATNYQTPFGGANGSASDRGFYLNFVRAANGQTVSFTVENANDPNRLQAVSSQTWTVGRWHLIAGVWESATSCRVYIDGVLGGTDTGNLSEITGMTNIEFGRWSRSSPVNYLSGRVAEARMYNRIVTAAEMRQMYDAQTRWDLYRTARVTPLYAPTAAASTPDRLRITQPHRRIIAAAPGPVAVW